ncbi:P-loop containing nucleoside triphosphate hydrolase protein [Roridomyces roridus]|uniref:P-loop containing nucleoside triphosphate hydrolase protein n=1 Tax=Roridomyces roridus TaxID=1738132 RepID=A0AAD7FWA7_9AGAR|nr:P-loop containing nucleoside triphosphate hydrolase protein [Roridomyces roridus]
MPTHTIADHIENHGGRTIVAFKAARLVSCLVLLSLSLVSLVLEETDEQEETADFVSHRTSRQVALCVTYLYTTVLAIVSLASSERVSRTVVPHINTILLFVFGVYFYRDILPLATYNLHPKDLSEGPILWAKISVLFIAGVAIPLLVPRKYTPLDPKNPMPEPNPEQTASILSLVLYFFLDKIVFLAYRIPHLKLDQLPPLADYDYAQYLKTTSFRYLDAFAGKKRHVFFGIIWVYRWRILVMALMCTIMALAPFLSPIGLNRLLSYLENPDEEQTVKPWFWCLFLLIGPLIHSLSFQWYIFVSTHMMVNTTAIITQLVFEHALRIRVKAETGNKAKDAEDPAKKGKTANLQGKMTNLVTTDLSTINEARNILFLVILVPVQIVAAIVFLYQILSWSAFVGMGVMVALFPLPGYVAKLQQAFQKKTMEKTDARVQTVTETINVLRMVKYVFRAFYTNCDQFRYQNDELTWIWRRKLLQLANNTINGVIPVLTMLATFGKLSSFPFCSVLTCCRFIATYVSTLIAKQDLSAAKVFSSMAVFDMLRNQLWFTFYCIRTSVNGKVSLDRLEEFLQTTELLDSFTTKNTPEFLVADEPTSDVIGFRDATFAWSNDEADGTLTPSSRRFLLKIEGELFFKPDCVNLVVGPTGSGKTSLLMALLGEMHFVRSSPSSWYNLPRGEGVAYAAQESWVQNDTIRNNIIFTSPVNEERYKKVLYQCALERDLELFDAGDQTEVGEKGLTLSGGQKARVTLARAIYSNAKIILLDDILAALDVHTAKWIVDKCLRGDLIQGRTVVLVTHNVVLATETAKFVVSLDENLAKEVQKDQEILENAEKEVDSQPVEETKKAGAGKLILAEEIAIGRVSWSALNLFFTGMGGSYTPLFFSVLMGFFLVSEAFITLQTWYLGFWASHYGQGVAVPALKYLGGFSILLFGGILLAAGHFLFFTLGSFRASRTIHKQLVESVLGTTLRWLDVTPASRIITRSTQDISAIDGGVPDALQALLEITVAVLTKFFAVVLFAPISFFGGVLVGLIGGMCGRIYLASQLSVKREMSNAKAPVLAHFGATMAGLVSVRAYGAQDALIQTSMNRIDQLSRATRIFSNLNRWITVRSDVLGGLFASTTAIYVVYFQHQRPFNVGFILVMALGFAEMILYWVRVYNMFEIQGNSLERLVQYTTIEQEPKPTKAGVPPAYWPSSGSLSVDNLSARYSPDGPKVLEDVSFNIKSGERVGVVGRTGSGKSSLTLSLLRCIFTDGEVYYDNIPTSTLNLDALRSSITIIPQVPELLVGTLRSNLDPFEQVDDATLNDALRAAGLSALQDEMEEGRLTLDSEISAGGGNLSVGQRQIIALARAIVRGSKLMILDEATSAIDYKTDAVIQKSLRELSSDTTLFTVAHRLQTIMDADKIMVLDAGRVVEFDTPKTLLQNKDGLLHALVEESGDKEVLYKMAQA